ncbi:dynein regulatory complex subunit 3 [Anaeramoeba flamelloides]|uniref:Dynein regulatory complex subunit 3 n=1 Tax=Anaeramoeba flamelloides TaxID=1746091 RepID=A0ABQ8XWQ3_9EUKA|nr:dynein regulatory complex subunit 3 [Anaeramoeba flamelloides]
MTFSFGFGTISEEHFLRKLHIVLEQNWKSLKSGKRFLSLNALNIAYLNKQLKEKKKITKPTKNNDVFGFSTMKPLESIVSELLWYLSRISNLRIEPIGAQRNKKIEIAIVLEKIFRNLNALEINLTDVDFIVNFHFKILPKLHTLIIGNKSINHLASIFYYELGDKRISIPKCNLKTLSCPYNKLTNIDVALTSAENLTKLDFSHNRLSIIENLESSIFLDSLNLSFNRIKSLSTIHLQIGSLRELILTHNQITSLDGICKLYSMEVLDISSNCISSFQEIQKLTGLPLLKQLFLNRNPICKVENYLQIIMWMFSRCQEFEYFENRNITHFKPRAAGKNFNLKLIDSTISTQFKQFTNFNNSNFWKKRIAVIEDKGKTSNNDNNNNNNNNNRIDEHSNTINNKTTKRGDSLLLNETHQENPNSPIIKMNRQSKYRKQILNFHNKIQLLRQNIEKIKNESGDDWLKVFHGYDRKHFLTESDIEEEQKEKKKLKKKLIKRRKKHLEKIKLKKEEEEEKKKEMEMEKEKEKEELVKKGNETEKEKEIEKETQDKKILIEKEGEEDEKGKGDEVDEKDQEKMIKEELKKIENIDEELDEQIKNDNEKQKDNQDENKNKIENSNEEGNENKNTNKEIDEKENNSQMVNKDDNTNDEEDQERNNKEDQEIEFTVITFLVYKFPKELIGTERELDESNMKDKILMEIQVTKDQIIDTENKLNINIKDIGDIVVQYESQNVFQIQYFDTNNRFQQIYYEAISTKNLGQIIQYISLLKEKNKKEEEESERERQKELEREREREGQREIEKELKGGREEGGSDNEEINQLTDQDSKEPKMILSLNDLSKKIEDIPNKNKQSDKETSNLGQDLQKFKEFNDINVGSYSQFMKQRLKKNQNKKSNKFNYNQEMYRKNFEQEYMFEDDMSEYSEYSEFTERSDWDEDLVFDETDFVIDLEPIVDLEIKINKQIIPFQVFRNYDPNSEKREQTYQNEKNEYFDLLSQNEDISKYRVLSRKLQVYFEIEFLSTKGESIQKSLRTRYLKSNSKLKTERDCVLLITELNLYLIKEIVKRRKGNQVSFDLVISKPISEISEVSCGFNHQYFSIKFIDQSAYVFLPRDIMLTKQWLIELQETFPNLILSEYHLSTVTFFNKCILTKILNNLRKRNRFKKKAGIMIKEISQTIIYYTLVWIFPKRGKRLQQKSIFLTSSYLVICTESISKGPDFDQYSKKFRPFRRVLLYNLEDLISVVLKRTKRKLLKLVFLGRKKKKNHNVVKLFIPSPNELINFFDILVQTHQKFFPHHPIMKRFN